MEFPMTRTVLATAVLVLVGTGAALAETVEFTADAVQHQSGQGLQSGKLSVGAAGSRFEFQDHGRPIVQISLPSQGLVRVLSPLDRSYMEFKTENGAPTPDARPTEPCKASAEVECKREGEEQILGMKLERWSVKAKGAPGETRVWWDKERRMPLRQVLFDGSTMQAAMTGTEDHDGRKVESWEITYTSPNGQYRRGMALYAPDIGATVLEHQPGGMMRELRNIVVGKLDAKLFEVPEGFRKLELPPPPKPGEMPAPQAGSAPAVPQAAAPQKPAQAQPAPAQAMGPPRPPQAAAPSQPVQPPAAVPAPPAGPYAGAAPASPPMPTGPAGAAPQAGQPQPGQMYGSDMPMGPPPGYPVGPRMGRRMMPPPDMDMGQGMGGQQGMGGMSGAQDMGTAAGSQTGVAGQQPQAWPGMPSPAELEQMQVPPRYRMGPYGGRYMPPPADISPQSGIGGGPGGGAMTPPAGAPGQPDMAVGGPVFPQFGGPMTPPAGAAGSGPAQGPAGYGQPPQHPGYGYGSGYGAGPYGGGYGQPSYGYGQPGAFPYQGGRPQ
jgi:hypothetical protein